MQYEPHEPDQPDVGDDEKHDCCAHDSAHGNADEIGAQLLGHVGVDVGMSVAVAVSVGGSVRVAVLELVAVTTWVGVLELVAAAVGVGNIVPEMSIATMPSPCADET